MKKNIATQIIWLFSVTLFIISCKKQDEFLNAKPNDALSVPSTLADLQLMLQDEGLFVNKNPALGQIGSDDFYITASTYNNLTQGERNTYSWEKEIYPVGGYDGNWTYPYNQVYITNIILDVLPTVTVKPSEQSNADQVKASALFLRSLAFYNLVQTYALPYDSATSGKDPGIVLRMTSNVTAGSVRATVQECYDQIIKDLKTALPLLPITAQYVTMPSQPAANAILARVSMDVGNYPEAFKYADACLGMYNKLMDFNTVPLDGYGIALKYVTEDILHRTMLGYTTNISGNNNAMIDSNLYQSYAANDLRKGVYIREVAGLPYFYGSYDYSGYGYTGVATDEVYLMRAECSARAGNTSAAMKDLNDLLRTRWKTGTFADYTATSAEDALRQILTERRKELIDRGLRWTDLRRLNRDPRFAVTLVRNIDGKLSTLPPNDPRYALPIPDAEIIASHIQQNPR